jgi:multimeric flavodoxin WrbA
MKVVAFNGSPRKEGNTYTAIKLVTDKLQVAGIDVEIIHVGNKIIRGCLACGQCEKLMNEHCVIEDDVNGWVQTMKDADGIIIGSPTHSSAIAGTMKSFLDRAFYVTHTNGSMLRHKVGVAVTAARRSGGVPTFNQLNNYLNYSEMIIPTSIYWNVIHGSLPGEAMEDKEGVQIMEILGENMVMALKQKEASVAIPQHQPRITMNFIR